MKFSLLFWGFQDLNLVSEVARKARYSLNIKDFYIQINDLEKTVSLMDLYPEEIIRTKYDLGNLYQWLSRGDKKNIIIVIDLFSIISQLNFEDNYLALKKLLKLSFKICFVAPKILHPESLRFLNTVELNSIHQETIEYTRSLKSFYEIIINSNSTSHIISSPVPEIFILNRESYYLFETKTKYSFIILPKILKHFNVSYISQKTLILNLVETIAFCVKPSENLEESILNNIEADCTTQYSNPKKSILHKLKPMLPVSLEHFFKVKNSTPELKFLLWLMYLSICEYEVWAEKSLGEPLLSDAFFSSKF